MEMLLPIIIPTVLVPLVLSAISWWLIRRYPTTQWALPFIWLLPYVWLNDIPSIPPSEAKDWLWIMVIVSVLLNFKYKSHRLLLSASQTILLAVILIAVAWPALQHQLNILLLIQLSGVVIAAYFLIYFSEENKTPTLSLATTSGGLSLVLVLGGSLLIGQFAGALAALLGVFAIYEIANAHQQKLIIKANALIPLTQLYLTLLVIAYIYVDIQLELILLLLIAPMLSLISRLRYSYIYSAITVLIALGWLLSTIDSSGYY